MRDILEEAPPTVPQPFDEGFYESIEEEGLEVAAEPKRHPSVVRSQSSLGSHSSSVRTRSVARAEHEES